MRDRARAVPPHQLPRQRLVVTREQFLASATHSEPPEIPQHHPQFRDQTSRQPCWVRLMSFWTARARSNRYGVTIGPVRPSFNQASKMQELYTPALLG